ncbi:MAG: ribosome assembly RNA-binding protein YhbY [Gammaproteobacteria bacterium]|nr:ribosome assembly RNA-binding protein YhbY [Gammaproteobacteria bacterium]
MKLTERQRKYLRRLAHDVKPVVQVGNSGLTDGLLAELNDCLTRHELIKVKVRVGNRDLRDETIDELSRITGAEVIQRVGNTASLYRPRLMDSGITLP